MLVSCVFRNYQISGDFLVSIILGPLKCLYSMSTTQTQMTEQSYSFRGIFTDKNYSTRLGYMALTAQDAWDLCTELNPTFLVQNWGLEGQVD